MSHGSRQAYPLANGADHVNGGLNRGPDRYEEDYRRPSAGDMGTTSRGYRDGGGYDGSYDNRNRFAPTRPDSQPSSFRGSETDYRDGAMQRRNHRPEREGLLQTRSRDNIRPGGGSVRAADSGVKQIEDVLSYIQREWTVMTEENCVPVQVALQLMDSSSLGRAHQSDQFSQTYKQLQKALQAVVNEHLQDFSSTLGTFHAIQASLRESQNRMNALRQSVFSGKSNLSTTKPALKDLVTSSQSYGDMLQLLGRIEQLQAIPEKLEGRISEKKFLTAVDILHDALRLVRTTDKGTIGALADLTAYISNQETSLTDILIEELHNHLYLKSPYCQDRWKSTGLEFGEGPKVSKDKAIAGTPTNKPIYQFLENLDLSSPMVDDASRNPEVDTFYYIHLLLEALGKMDQLELAVSSIEQRMPTELFRLVERTNAEIELRHRDAVRPSPSIAKGDDGLGLADDDLRETIISDLLCTLYSKFQAIAEAHRVLHEVITGMLQRKNIEEASPLTGGFKELWKLYQNEIRTILHDYLATDGHSSFRSARHQAGASSVFQRPARDKSKRVFMFSHIDSTTPELASAQDDLEAILKTSVPGLVSESRRLVGMTGLDSHAHHDGSATGHKMLVEPSVFNMTYLLAPSLSFIQRLKEIVPSTAKIDINNLTSFLDDFLVNVFHPQLDEALTDLSAQIFIELDAFQQDPQSADGSKRPIFKGTLSFLRLIRAFCRMLDSIPRDQDITQLIIAQMITYYDKCRGYFKSLVTRAESNTGHGIRLKAAAALSESDDLRRLGMQLWETDGAQQPGQLQEEAELLITYTHETPLEPSDLISDRKSIASLCLLYNSMKWLVRQLSRLRRLVDDDHSSEPDIITRPGGRRGVQWILQDPRQTRTDPSTVYLPLTKDNVASYDATLTSYEELATSVLLTLHMEIRATLILHVTKSLRNNYLLSQPIAVPDPGLLSLNGDLVAFDEILSTHLLRLPAHRPAAASTQPAPGSRAPRSHEHAFVTTGLAILVDTMLVRNAGQIGAMNRTGCDRMRLNMLVLQQNLNSIDRGHGDGHPPHPHSVFHRSPEYFDLFLAGPDAILRQAAEEKKSSGGGGGGGDGTPFVFGYDALKVLLELCYSENLASDRREVAVQAKKALNDHLFALSEQTWEAR